MLELKIALVPPETWDAVPRTGKLLTMYKRPGERVLINTVGDIRVRPTVFEVNLHTTGYSVKRHYLTSYLDALGSIVVAQLFRSKAMDGGISGVKRLSKMPDICKLLNSVGVDLPSLVKQYPLRLKSIMKGRGRRKKKFRVGSNLVGMIRELGEMPIIFQAD